MKQPKLYRTPDSPRYVGGYNWRPVGAWAVLSVLAMWLATQFTAWRLGFQPALGAALWRVDEFAIYAPWMVFYWLLKFMDASGQVKSILMQGTMVAGMGSMVSVFGALWVNAHRHRALERGAEDLHGSARFATYDEVKEAGLIDNPNGVTVGGIRHPTSGAIKYLRHDGPEHVLVFAPTRSGKGVSLVLPTLLTWQGSTLNNDLKGELWAKTAGYRQSLGHKCYKFSPVEEESAKFNPLLEIRVGTTREVADAQNMAALLVYTEDKDAGGDASHWQQTAMSIMTGVILHECYSARRENRHPTLHGLTQIFTRPGQGFRNTLSDMLTYEHDPDYEQGWTSIAGKKTRTHPVVAEKAQELLDKEDKEFSGVLSTAKTALILYADPLVIQNTSGSDFRIRDLVDDELPHDVYIVVPESDKIRLRPLVRLFYTIAVNRLAERMDFKDGKTVANRHRLQFVIDEFASLGNMELFADALSYMAGYGLHAYLIVQDYQQILDRYGEHESILSNCHIRAAFAPNNLETAKILSAMTGQRTIQRSSVNYSGNRLSPILGHMTTSIEHIERELLAPDEVMRLKAAQKTGRGAEQRITAPGEMLIFVSGMFPVYGTQTLYFQDPVLLKRSQIPPPSPLARGEGGLFRGRETAAGGEDQAEALAAAWSRESQEPNSVAEAFLDGIQGR